jgi:hypothetical protein
LSTAWATLCALAMSGEYVWRAPDQSRRRPLYVVEGFAKAIRRDQVRTSARLQLTSHAGFPCFD